MKRSKKLSLLFDFLKDKEKNKINFTTEAAESFAGYSAGTVNKYITQYLQGEFVEKFDDTHWSCSGISKLSLDEFLKLLSQSAKAKTLSTDEKFIKGLSD